MTFVWLAGGLLALLVVAALLLLYVFGTLVPPADRDPRRLAEAWKTPFRDQPWPASPPPAAKAFGSGHFGAWVEDRFALPAYAYTCDQFHDPKAVTPVSPAWQSPVRHWHQVGNDRVVALAANDGTVQVRQDEGGPKLLNDFDPRRCRFAGGFGYLTDGAGVLSTMYPGHAVTFERTFGLGYVEKRVSGRGLGVRQVVFAPFGDDPLVVSEVEVENRRPTPAEVRWVEYWESAFHPLSFRAFVLSLLTKGRTPASALRRAFAAAFSTRVAPALEGRALVATHRFEGEGWKVRTAWAIACWFLDTFARERTVGAIRPAAAGIAYDDPAPPPTFLAALDAPPSGASTDGDRFFGHGGVLSPDGLAAPFGPFASGRGGTALLMERRLRLEPGAKATLRHAFGYLPEGVTLEGLVAKHGAEAESLWERSTRAWAGERISLDVPGEDWVDRELLWHGYYLRSALTFDRFFGEHVLSQGHVYQYLMGFQGAARDPLQHALPFVYSRPEVAREVLRYTLQEVAADGALPYGIVGHGKIMPAPFRPSDQQLWLLWLASEYVLATRDVAFLREEIPTGRLYGRPAARATVAELLARCCRHFVDVVGTGKHGLARLSNGDWNDGAVLGFVPKDQVTAVREGGESVLNAAFATWVLDLYARMLDFAAAGDGAAEVRAKAGEQRAAVRRQWTGRWFRRQWLTDALGWIGDDVLWLEPQPWAILGGAATAEQRKTLVESIDDLVRRPSAIGATLHSRPLDELEVPAGELVNAGIWPSINGTLVWALAKVDGRLAWDEWRKNTLAWHAERYPDVWYGIWSGPDCFNSVHSARPGGTYAAPSSSKGDEAGPTVSWTDFPVMNLHPHAWTLYAVPKLLGVELTAEGITIEPALPLPEYRFRSPLLGLERTPAGYEGWYAPLRAGEWAVALKVPPEDARRFTRVTVNGETATATAGEGGAFRFRGPSAPGAPLRFRVE
jgi:hypothetical protein